MKAFEPKQRLLFEKEAWTRNEGFGPEFKALDQHEVLVQTLAFALS